MAGFCRGFVLAISIGVLGSVASPGIAVDPPMPPAAEGPTWGGGDGAPGAAMHAAVERGGTFACPPLARPGTAVIGADIWDLVNRKPLAWQIDGQVADHAICAVSTDARCFAAQTGTGHEDQQAIGIWSLQTGKSVSVVIAGGKDRNLDFIGFSGPDAKQASKWLIAVGPNNNPKKKDDWDKGRTDVWDWEAGAVHHSFLTNSCAQHRAVLSPDGKYLAVCGNNHLCVYDVRAGREAAVMKDPGVPPEPGSTRVNRAGAKADPRLRAGRAAFPGGGVNFPGYGFCCGLSFSPDGRELAGLFGWGPSRLIIWDSSGRVSYDSGRHPLPGRLTSDRYNRGLLWSPDGSRLLLSGECLFDRKSEMIVYKRPMAFGEDRMPTFLDDQTLLAVTGEASIDTVQIPVAEIKKSLAAINDPASPAIIRPGQKVSVTFEIVGTARGDADKTRELLTTAMSEALAREGLVVADAQPVEFHLTFEEAAGDSLPVFEKSNPFDMRGTDTGRKATEAKSKLSIDLKSAGTTDELWSQQLAGISPRSVNGPVDDNSLRDGMLQGLVGRMHGLEIPSFIPKTPDVKPLPIMEN